MYWFIEYTVYRNVLKLYVILYFPANRRVFYFLVIFKFSFDIYVIVSKINRGIVCLSRSVGNVLETRYVFNAVSCPPPTRCLRIVNADMANRRTRSERKHSGGNRFTIGIREVNETWNGIFDRGFFKSNVTICPNAVKVSAGKLRGKKRPGRGAI